MWQPTFERLVGALLLAGAIVFVLLLAGIGSELLTNPIPYHP
jgi:hypothetical protein